MVQDSQIVFFDIILSWFVKEPVLNIKQKEFMELIDTFMVRDGLIFRIIWNL